jgi:hypothetical protein
MKKNEDAGKKTKKARDEKGSIIRRNKKILKMEA